MRFAARHRGIIRALFRERQPFAVLAILAAMLPYVLSGAGLHSGSGGIRLADGSFVVCTSDGFQRIADPTGTGEHDLNDCCKSGCVHAFSKIAIGPASAAPPVRVALESDIVWVPLADPAHRVTAGSTPSIRAPPAVSA